MSQSSVFPLTASMDLDDDPRTVDLFSEEADRMIDALGSDTARTILGAVSDEPMTKSEIADRIDTSVQNAHYHLNRLHEAGLVRIAGTRYSSRGTEMDVYAVDGSPLVLVGRFDGTGHADTAHKAEEMTVRSVPATSD